MATTSAVFGFPVPEGTDANNVPGDLADLTAELDKGFAGARLSQSQIDALPSGYRQTGVHVYNLTAQRIEAWNGAAWVPVVSPGAWAAWTPTVTGFNGVNPSSTAAGRFVQVGKSVHWNVQIETLGGTGALYFTLPVTPVGTIAHIGHWNDQGTGTQHGAVVLSNTVPIRAALAIGLGGVTLPRNSSYFVASGTYEAA